MDNEKINFLKSKLKENGFSSFSLVKNYDTTLEIRSLDIAVRRMCASAIMAKCAFDLYDAPNADTVKKSTTELLKQYDSYNSLFSSERDVLEKPYNEPLSDTICWRYESARAIMWVLGFFDNIDTLSLSDDIEHTINEVYNFILKYNNIDEIMSAAKLRNGNELSEQLILYFTYHWNMIDALITKNRDKLNDLKKNEVVRDIITERRRAFEWLLLSEESEDEDWDFPLDT